MSGHIVHLAPDAHRQVQTLLPWYATDRLAPSERDAVEAHLAACAECRDDLAAERQWQRLQPVDAPPADVDAGWARMRARLGDDAGVAGASSRAGLPDLGDFPEARDEGRAPGARRPARHRARRAAPARVPAWLAAAFSAPRAAWAAPAALSVALLVALGVVGRPASSGQEFHALGAAAPLDGATAVVRFRPEATEAQIRRSLKDSGARFVDGPTVTDAYVVRLPRDHYADALATLRRQPGVALVEALETAPPP